MDNTTITLNKCNVKRVLKAVPTSTNYACCIFTTCVKGQEDMFPPEVRRYGGMTAEFKATSQHIPVELLKKISFRLEGHWAPDSKEENEKIFVAEKATEILPETESEVCKFLMRNCSSLGKTMANHIVERFGMNTLDVCAHHCKQLFDIPRIDDKVIAKLNDACLSALVRADVLKLLQGVDVSPSAINTLVETYGNETIHVLENQTYVGDTINNKSTQKLFAGQDKCDLPKEQWCIAKDTHPAIIARDDFEKVQKILDKNRKVFNTVRAKSEQIRAEYQNDLAGMVFCADCGRPMEFERLPHGAEESKKVCYYICKARQADDKCIGHQIPEKLLKALIMDQLHLFIVQLCDKRKVLEELQKIEDVQNPVYRAKGEIMSLTDKVSQMAKKREQLYADYVAGVVDSEDYQLIREDYSRQYDGLRAALQEAESKKTEVERQIEEYLNMTSHLEEHLDNFEFDIQLVKSLVQKIEVSADKRIRIVFGFQNVFTELGKESAET